MDKTAKSRAKDPEQDKVRAGKAVVNQRANNFIQEILAFKRGINGRGDVSAGLPASRIHHPMPREVRSYLHQLAQAFADLTAASESVMDSQDQYAEHRAERSALYAERAAVRAVREEEITKLAQDLAVQAGLWWGWGSQFLNHFRLLGDKDRKLRLVLLRALLNFKEELKEFEDQLVHFQDPAFIPASFTQINSIVAAYFGAFLNVLPDIPQAAPEPTDSEQAQFALLKSLVAQKEDILGQIKELPEFQRIQVSIPALKLYELIQEALTKQSLDHFDIIQKLFKEVQNLLKQAESTKTAKPNLFHKLVNEQRLRWNPSNRDIALTKALEMSRECRDLTRQVFEAISTKGKPFAEIIPSVLTLNQRLTALLEQMLTIGTDYMLDHRRLKKDKDSYQKDIRREDLTRIRESIRMLKGWSG